MHFLDRKIVEFLRFFRDFLWCFIDDKNYDFPSKKFDSKFYQKY